MIHTTNFMASTNEYMNKLANATQNITSLAKLFTIQILAGKMIMTIVACTLGKPHSTKGVSYG